MTLTEMSLCYARTAALLQRRIQSLRAQEPEDPEAAFHLHRRISELTPLLREARALAALTEHYYDRSFYGYEQYRL
ncbi:MAG: hypothetical protein HFG00_11950 [Oscillibacter sp.]|nr:hypothetical protein [Oscillibacter sp.]